MGKKIEIFTADCSLCRKTIKAIRKEVCGECEIIEHHCSGDECSEQAKKYGIKAVPTVVVDGKITIVGKPGTGEVRAIFA